MAWIGKLIGGAVGFAIGGPLGAIAGASLGNKFDKAKSTYELIKSERPYYYGNPIDQISRQEQLQYIFFTSIFTLLGKIANADGSISQQEINVLEDFLNRDLCLDESAKKFAKKLFFESANSNTDFKNIASQFYENFKNEKELLLTMIELLINLAMADGKLHPDEEKLILLTKQIFNIIDNDYQQILAKYIENFDRYYLILGCSKNDSNTTIQKNFRKLANEYHPDKIIAKGLPEEFIKFANQKFQEINEAYNKIMKKRNFQSEKNDPNHDDDDDEFKSDQKVKSNYNKFINVHDDAINNNYSFDYNKLKKIRFLKN